MLWLVGALMLCLPPAGLRAASLSVSREALATGAVLDLPALGGLDWVHWGLAATNDLQRRDAPIPVLTNLVMLGTALLEQTNGFGAACTWTNGVPLLAATNVTGALLVRGVGNGFQLQLPAGPEPRRLRLSLGAVLAQGRLEASLSDLDGLPVVDTSMDGLIEPVHGLYTIDFVAGSTGQTLVVSFTIGSVYDPALAEVRWQAVALSVPPSNQPPVVALNCPVGLANYQATDPMPFCVTATDPDGVVRLVEYFAGPTKIGGSTNSPFSWAWTNAWPGQHSLTAAATDDRGTRTVSAPVTVWVHSGLGQLSVAGTPPPGAINLTAEGLTDWAHWGLESEFSFNHKAGVASQIRNYTYAGVGPAYAYFDNVETYTWTDGTPTPSIFNYPAGVYCAGLGEGFEVRVAADTTVKTLRVYVGAYGARGRLQAWLDDYSAPVLFDQSLINPGNGPGLAYTVQFRAAAPGRSLVLRYTVAEMLDPFGNVTLQAATLVGENNPPGGMIVSPTNRTVLSAPGSFVLEVSASDPDGTVAKVEYFRGLTKLGETTVAPHAWPVSGLAAGNYDFSARVTDDEGATFTTLPVRVHVITGGGILGAGFTAAPAQVHLSAEGTLDWAHWGSTSQNSFVRRQGGNQLANVKVSGGPRQRYTDNATGFTWTNGTPVLAVNGTTTGIFVRRQDSSFEMTIPANATVRRLRLYLGLYGARGRLEASLSDFSAAPFVDESLVNSSGNAYRAYTIYYAAASSGASLTVRWSVAHAFDETYGNVTWQAAAMGLPDLRLRLPRWEPGGFTFTLLTWPGVSHAVEWTETLAPGGWQLLTNIPGSGAEVDVTDPSPAAPSRVYRVRAP